MGGFPVDRPKSKDNENPEGVTRDVKKSDNESGVESAGSSPDKTRSSRKKSKKRRKHSHSPYSDKSDNSRSPSPHKEEKKTRRIFFFTFLTSSDTLGTDQEASPDRHPTEDTTLEAGLIQEGLVPSPYRTHQRTRGGQRLAVALHRAAAVTGKRVFLQLGNEEIPQVFWIVEE
ncbi:hypothetical protein BSL78_18703 [Apostichopus japonicus]|uniref:Uncharacterized protein n=1 Tax=Stichopus japonicus TaxID=307972 RepID=A0A2G8K8U3_STIJA|nr:hypothetical protein BSL78_18703 [Apostichopus japonicus]